MNMMKFRIYLPWNELVHKLIVEQNNSHKIYTPLNLISLIIEGGWTFMPLE